MNPQEFQKWNAEESDKYGFQVPYNGSKEFYDGNAIEHFKTGADAAFNLLSKEIEDLKQEVESNETWAKAYAVQNKQTSEELTETKAINNSYADKIQRLSKEI